MKKVIQKQITSYVITLTIASTLTIFSSCSSDSDKSDPIETTVSDEESKTHDHINKNPILLWDFIRKDSHLVRKVFAESCNKFTFQPDSSFHKKRSMHM